MASNRSEPGVSKHPTSWLLHLMLNDVHPKMALYGLPPPCALESHDQDREMPSMVFQLKNQMPRMWYMLSAAILKVRAQTRTSLMLKYPMKRWECIYCAYLRLTDFHSWLILFLKKLFLSAGDEPGIPIAKKKRGFDKLPQNQLQHQLEQPFRRFQIVNNLENCLQRCLEPRQWSPLPTVIKICEFLVQAFLSYWVVYSVLEGILFGIFSRR